MKRSHDPLHLDVAALAAEQGRLQGQWPGAELQRLAQSQAAPQDMALSPVDWQAEAGREARAGADDALWLSISARCRAWLVCQRCLQPFDVPLAPHNRIRFVRDEAEAEALDAELDDDVLALEKSLDLRALIEDELLLALPLVPRHAVCPQPLPMLAADGGPASDDAAAEHPFAKLKALTTTKAGSTDPPGS